MLRCEFQLHVCCADVMELLGHDMLRDFRFVAFAAQMAQIKMLQLRRHDFRHALRRGFVREMAVSPEFLYFLENTNGQNPVAAVIDPSNKYVLACDLGDDVILVFPVTPGAGDSVRVPLRVGARPGSGPRHVAFHPNGSFVYCIHEIDCTIDLYDWRMQQGQPVMRLRENSVVSTLAKGASTKGNTASEIVISDDGRFLYACTRGEDSIAAYRIDENGYLSEVQRVSAGGKVPRYIAFDPSRRWLVCCNQGANGNVAVFLRDAATGRLGVKPRVFQALTPMFALWV